MLPPGYFPLVYNPLDYYNQTDSLTLEYADSRYNRKYGLNYCSDIYVSGSIYVGGSALTLDGLAYVSDITAGTPQNSKALTLDSTGKINGGLTLTGDISAANVSGTITTASQPNITSTGSLTSLNVGGTVSGSSAKISINANTLYSSSEGQAHAINVTAGNSTSNVCLYMGSDQTNGLSYIQSSKV